MAMLKGEGQRHAAHVNAINSKVVEAEKIEKQAKICLAMLFVWVRSVGK